MTPAAPVSEHDITSQWASAAFGIEVDVERVRRIGEEYGFAGETYRVDLDGLDVPSVAVKLWPMRSPDDDRELRFYREIASRLPIRLPRFHAGGADPGSLRGWLAIEYLAHCRQGDDLVAESAESVGRIADVLAAIHAATTGRLGAFPWLAAPSRPGLEADGIADRSLGYVERFGALPQGPARDLFDALPRAIPHARSVIGVAPDTLVHRDLAYDNMLFAPPDEKPILLDWQWCQLGAGVQDLASLLFTLPDPALFRIAVDRYVSSLEAAGAEPPLPSWLDAGLVLAFATRTLGVVRWAAQTDRGLAILDQSVDATPQVVEAWRSLDPERFDRFLTS